jgi:hypothetical protein
LPGGGLPRPPKATTVSTAISTTCPRAQAAALAGDDGKPLGMLAF